MTTIFIRHGEKKYKNGKGKPAHDSPLIPGQEETVKNMTIDLISKYGRPTKLIVSPFERTRETAIMIQHTINKYYNEYCVIYYDKKIEEYLGWQKPRHKVADINEYTQMYTKPLLGVEKLEDCERRIIDFYNQLDKNKNVWVITHGILMSYLYHHLNKEKKEFGCLDNFVVKNEK